MFEHNHDWKHELADHGEGGTIELYAVPWHEYQIKEFQRQYVRIDWGEYISQ